MDEPLACPIVQQDGAGRASDLQYWERTARTILQHARDETIVVEKSTVPVRTAEAMERPSFFFDGRNRLDPERLFKIGFNVYPTGRPDLSTV